ncbi:EGFR-like transmembrane domain-containing protein [endosymbiont GvMRE of Glomus versiforme]|nr:transmembrane domain-containing protein [endosymbiont GvMRE of Glomus versiforme]
MAANNSQSNDKFLNSSTYLLIGGLVLFCLAVLAIGYWLGKRKNKYFEKD